jgi:predicted phosphodiesterase
MNNATHIAIETMLNERTGMRTIAAEMGVTEWAVRKIAQELRDRNGFDNKKSRKAMRAENAIEQLNAEVLGALTKVGAKLSVKGRRSGKLNAKKAVAVLHLSDLHLNELISMPDNEFDFTVAAKRLQLLVMKTKRYCRAMDVDKVVIFIGGDICNSDRRVDEVMNMATNRSRAMVLGVHLLRQLVLDLRQDYFVDIFGITGNEGRAKQELSWSDNAVTDSYDASIYYMLKTVLEVNKDRGLRVHQLTGNEAIFSIHGKTFLGLHGHQLSAHDQKKVQSIIGKHSQLTGTRIDMVLCGHIHASYVGDFVARNASLSGGNAYSNDGLQLASKAAQNLHIVVPESKGCPAMLDGIKLDVQNYDGVEGYEIISHLEEYTARGSDKAAQAASNQPRRLVVVV